MSVISMYTTVRTVSNIVHVSLVVERAALRVASIYTTAGTGARGFYNC